MKRRSFLQGAAAGSLTLFFSGLAEAAPVVAPRPGDYPQDFNAFLKIGADGRIGCFVGKVELGQGIMTALAVLVAEELEVDPAQVDMLMGDTDLCPWDNATGGSLTMWQTAPALRGAAAEARAVLLGMAARTLGAAPADLALQDGLIWVKAAPSRKVSFGDLVKGRRLERHLGRVRPKPLAACTRIGKPAPRKDALAKLTGAARYVGDLRLPGTLHACILRPPAHGLTLAQADTAAAEAVPGVRIVRDGTLLAVLHAQPDTARKALALVKGTFQGAEPAVDGDTLYAHLAAKAGAALVVTSARGDLAGGERRASEVLEAEYRNAYESHATLEPHVAVAQWSKGRMTVWASTQNPFRIREDVAKAIGAGARDVRVISQFVGGGFGGKLVGPEAVEAARIARLVPETPVQLAWNREEDFFLDTFRPAAVVKIRAGLDKAGGVTFWDCQAAGVNQGEAEFAYDIPVQRYRAAFVPGLHPLPTGAWRAPSAHTNAFARECHLDMLAAKAGIDPVTFRRRLADDARVLHLLDLVLERSGWDPAPGPSGQGIGIACGAWRQAFVAVAAQVKVDRATGEVRVERVVEAVDVGLVVNPDGARQQVEGAVTMGVGQALAGEVRFKGGRILDRNFDTYRIPRFSWIPRIEVILADRPDMPSQGIGEPPVVPVAAAIANAVFDATGARVAQVPLTPARVLEALAAAGKK
ncbi:xanthine dehydrogenase family protein molybdopterin-binding subunit [Mesoterricola sediminis]|uniref:Aldehyde dehydrogenase n=1 Tax=Mesoterricola sediminis TaxID=2927980 RepID=A0AA48GPA5_9BACT|nr:molybdopterin cofactor-binding domain-containing protein [Mesoterricola sediminis]BDU75087.1 aldehyde dehydrogenase [Mesoterricola sediminis]